MNETSEFLLAAIGDKQSAIRAIDVKCGFLFFIIFYPLFRLDSVYPLGDELISETQCYSLPIAFIVGAWLLSLLALLKAVASIGNPAGRVSGAPKTNTYFMPNLFDLGLWSTVINPSVMSRKCVDEMLKSAPAEVSDVDRELMFENMKLAYIRDLKTKRVNACLGLIAIWVIGGAAIWILGMQ